MKSNDTNGFMLPIPTIEAIGALLDEKLKGITIIKEAYAEDKDEYLDIDGVRILLGGGNGKMVSKSTINNLRKQGIIKAHKLGAGRNALVRFKRSEIVTTILAHRIQKVEK